jgi:acyl-CoA thioesterase
MDPLEIVKEKFKNDKFAKSFGIALDGLTNETVKMHMKLMPEMNNFYDRIHGGAIYALADAAFSVIGNNQNNLSVALDCLINYHSSPEAGQTLYVEGKLNTQTNKIATYIFTIYTQKEGIETKVATMMSTLYRTGKPIDIKHNVL